MNKKPEKFNITKMPSMEKLKGDKEVLRKSKMLLDAANKEKDFQSCCPYAERTFCVCSYSCECELHGKTHIDSHE